MSSLPNAGLPNAGLPNAGLPSPGLGSRNSPCPADGAIEVGAVEVGAVIVTYHPPASLQALIACVRPQLSALVVVDNSGVAGEAQHLSALVEQHRGESICNPSNAGVARALNQGIARVAALGCPYALLLDQDSQVGPDFVARLLESLRASGSGAPPALVGANFSDPLRGEVHDRGAASGTAAMREVDTVITSGSLLSLAAYRDVGAFREDFFIDYVDLEFCFRLRARGHRVVVTRDVLMQHTVGRFASRRIGGWTVGTSNHPPARYYFMARNHLLVVRDVWRTHPRWAIVSLMNRARALFTAAIVEPCGGRTLRYVLLGWFDAIRGSTDRNPLLEPPRSR